MLTTILEVEVEVVLVLVLVLLCSCSRLPRLASDATQCCLLCWHSSEPAVEREREHGGRESEWHASVGSVACSDLDAGLLELLGRRRPCYPRSSPHVKKKGRS